MTTDIASENQILKAQLSTIQELLEVYEQATLENIRRREGTEKALIKASREAGMSEVATGVLHNVGNVLNSVNISVQIIHDRIKRSRIGSITKLAELLQKQTDLIGFYLNDAKAKELPGFLENLSEQLQLEQATVLEELSELAQNVEHIKTIISLQQSYARVGGLHEKMSISNLTEDALQMNAEAFSRHNIVVIRDYRPTSPISVEKHKVLQIVVNLIRNAKHALVQSGIPNKQMILRTGYNEKGNVEISISDNGIGIAHENLTRIFAYGFTTKKDGHGFGLHSGALAAKEMGGALTAHSDGIGFGATFVLELPAEPENAVAKGS